MPKRVCVVTGTRAEYGLLRPLVRRIHENPGMELRLAVTGAHLSAEFGGTASEIEADGFPIAAKIETLLSSDTNVGMAKSTGLGLISFADFFALEKPAAVVVLGDRYESFAAAAAAALMLIPVAHICGGDVSEGAVDDFLRHSITMMAKWHFVTNEASRARVLSFGKDPQTVFDVGSLGVENALERAVLPRAQLEADLGLPPNAPFALVTFHPATLEGDAAVSQIGELLAALRDFPNTRFVITKSNADSAGRAVNAALDAFDAPNCRVFASLGSARYLSAMKRAAAVIGNSSSGLYETPVFGVPCVNVGDRQKGRVRAGNVIDCEPNRAAITAAISRAFSAEFAETALRAANPFGDGRSSALIEETLSRVLASARGVATPPAM